MKGMVSPEPLVRGTHSKTEYPWLSMIVVLGLLYLVPFVSKWLSVLAFVICIYRIVRYDARIFAIDYAILTPVATLMHLPSGLGLVVFLALIGALWYFVREGVRGDTTFVVLIILLCYMLTRMQMHISNFVLCFGQIFFLFVLVPKQDEWSAEWASKAFCVSVVISSVYALTFRNTWALYQIRGKEGAALWGGTTLRFQGLMGDPNFYMTMLIIGLALLIKLKSNKRISDLAFVSIGGAMTVFGVLTYSKTFFLVYILLGGLYVMLQFRKKNNVKGIVFTVLTVVVFFVIVNMENSPVSVVLARFRNANNISELTTSRTDIYLAYLKVIIGDLRSLMIGQGLADEALYRDPHNLYLEILYYVGVIGSFLIFVLFCFLFREVNKELNKGTIKEFFVEKYIVVLMFLVLYFSLHGIFQLITYAGIFLAYMSLMIRPQCFEDTERETELYLQRVE